MNSSPTVAWPDVVKAFNSTARLGLHPLYHRDFLAPVSASTNGCRIVLAQEHHQHTGTVRVRGTANYFRAHGDADTFAVAVTSDATAAAWAWAAEATNSLVTLFVPLSFSKAAAHRLRAYKGVTVEIVATGDLGACCERFATASGALMPDPHDPLIAAGAGTWVRDIRCLTWNLDTVVISGNADGLRLGTIAVTEKFGLNTVVVKTDSIDDTGIQDLSVADQQRGRVKFVAVSREDVAIAHRMLQRCGVHVGDEGATALAALTTTATGDRCRYQPVREETVAVLLSAANNRGELPAAEVTPQR